MVFSKMTLEEWGRLVKVQPFATPFHSADWLSLVRQSLGGKLDLYRFEDEAGLWMIPCFSGLPWSEHGFRVGSIGYGGPLPPHGNFGPQELQYRFATLIDELADLRLEASEGAVTFPHPMWEQLRNNCGPAAEVYETHILAITDPSTMIVETLTKPVRTAIRKANRLGVEVSHLQEYDLAAAHAVLNDTQARVGAPYLTSLSFLKALASATHLGMVLVAKVGGKVVGVAAAVIQRASAFHLLHGWDRRFASTCSNQALLWQLARACHAAGVLYLDMGRSHYASLASAKSRWGARRVPVLSLKHRPCPGLACMRD